VNWLEIFDNTLLDLLEVLRRSRTAHPAFDSQLKFANLDN